MADPDVGVTTTTASALALTETNTTIPIIREGVIRREELLARLEDSVASPIVSVAAPAGYGKTTALAQWAESDPRPFAWLTVDERHDDPVLLIRSLLTAIDRAGIANAPRAARAPRVVASVWLTLVPELLAALTDSEAPYVLVVAQLHRLASNEALDVLGVVAGEIPAGSQLVLSGRTELTSLVAQRRVSGQLFELGATDLALTETESRELLAAAGAELADDVADEVIRHTEGWAAGLYLAALMSRRTGSAPVADVSRVGRFVEDYLRTEHLAGMPKKELTFLARSSVFERMRADICDAVLERRDSRRMLGEIERSNLFLVPLDHEREWYRYHDLFRGMLRHELDRTDPGAAEDLRRRAADWCEAHQLLEEAMAYAVASDDLERMARLLVFLAFPLYRSGRVVTLEGWLERFDDATVIGRYPAIAALGGLVHALRGRPFQAERWVDAAQRAPDTGPLPDGSSSARAWASVVEALLCRQGPQRMQQDAAFAVEELGPLSPLLPLAMYLMANAMQIAGDVAEADARLEEAAEAAEAMGASFVGATATTQRALLALARDDVPAAGALIDRASASVEHGQFHDYLPMALLAVARARVAIEAGDAKSAERQLVKAQRLRPYLTYAVPFYAVQTLVEMTRAYLDLGNANGARATLFDAGEVLRHRPDLGVLGDDVAGLHERAAAAERPESGWESSLTAAELRLLPLLTTHLSFREIGERLFVSRNTVKTQGISIYRKLGVSSRGEAVTRAAELGLVEPVVGQRGRITF